MIIVDDGEKRPFVPELIHKAFVTYVMTLESREVTENYAKLDFSKQKEKMRKNGWRIGDIMIMYPAEREVICGMQKNKEHVYIQRVYCERDTDEYTKEK
jgi:hypothetical protein